MKKSTTKQNKLVWALSLVLVALLAFTSVITFAYFSSEKTDSTADIQFGKLVLTGEDVTIVNEAEHKLVPGCTLTIDGTVAIETSINSLVRVKLAVAVEAADAQDVSALKTDIQNQLADHLGDNWIAGGDDYYYYNAVISSDNAALVDLDGADVTIAAATYGNDYQGATITFTLAAQAVQADHNGTGGVNITTVSVANIAEVQGAFTNAAADFTA